MTPPKESTITANIIKYLNLLPQTYARKAFSGRQSPYWPDVIGCSRGRMLALEVKRPIGSYGLTTRQAVELRRWNHAGAIAGVVTSVDDVIELLVKHSVIQIG